MKWIFACVAIAAALLVSDVELGRVPRRRRVNVTAQLADTFPDTFLCAPPNRLVEVMQGETEVNLGTVVPASDLTEPPVITLSNDGDCLYAVIIVCAYEKCLNGTETPEEEPEEETEEPEEDCVDEESEEELEEPEEEEMTDEEMAEEDMAEEEMPGYGYEYETLAACTNLDSDLDLVSGCELPYRPPTLTPGAGTKQCIVVVYKQDQEIDGEQTAEVCRTGVAPCQFRDDFCLPDPYAANYYNIDDVAQAMAEC